MVRKIQASEYLKRYDNMTADERQAYEERVGKWLSAKAVLLRAKRQDFNARLQNVQQASLAWNDAECQAFEEGAVLLSALVSTVDTWLPDMLYVKSAKRAIGNMIASVGAVVASEHEDTADGKPKEEAAAGKAASKRVQNGAGSGSAEREQARPEVNTKSETQPVGGKPAAKGPAKANVRMLSGAAKEAVYTVEPGGSVSISPDAKPTDVTQANPGNGQKSVVLPVPARPRHIDQYVHLLPEKTQERAAKYGEMMDELRAAREKLNLLVDDPAATDNVREAWAKKVKKLDDQIGAIKRELDEGWARLVEQGRVTVDDLGVAHVLPADDEPVNDEPAELTSEQKARRRELRKWLVDTRRGNGNTREEHIRKWQENFKEYLTLEGDDAYKDEKIRAAATHYALISLYAEWLNNSNS